MSSLRVFLVEDNPAFLEAATSFLAAVDHVAVVGATHSGAVALSRVSELRPDVVLANMDLSEFSGLIVAARIKALPDAPHVVLMSDREELPYRRLALAVDADAFLPKRNFAADIEALLASLPQRGATTDGKRATETANVALARIAASPSVGFDQPYGDLTRLNRSRLILDSIGKDAMTDIVGDFLEVVGTSAAVYERNGDYAFGTFSSGWCRLLDVASRDLCRTDDNAEALASGKWHCHESCWQASRRSMETMQPVDEACAGGIRIFALPIVARGEVVGSINFGYGSPPTDAPALSDISRTFGIDPERLSSEAAVQLSRHPALLDIAKRRLHAAARLIGEMVARRQVEMELRKSESRYRRMVESNIVGVIIADFDGAVIEANDAFLKMVGYTRDELARGQIRWKDLTPPEFRRLDDEALASWRREGNAAPWEKEYIRKDGSRVPVCVGLAQLEENADHCVALVLDLSQQRTAQRALREQRDQLYHAQKMATFGTLAAGMAHDFNNMLTAIFGYIEIVRDHAGDSVRLLDAAKHLQQAADQAAGVSRSLLTFSRKGATRRRPVSLNGVIEQLAQMVRRLMPDSIKFASDVQAPAPLWIYADETQILQVLLNIAINARDAMSGGGTIHLKLRHVEPDAENAAASDHGSAVIEIEDSGVGMSAEVQQRIFEPFFTTKPRGHGTGLGMAIVQSIVQEHDGTIDVQSVESHGTCMTVTLPCCDAPPAGVAAPERKRARGRGETLLLADDNPYVRKVVAASLIAAGFDVIECCNGLEAVEAFVRYGSRIRAVVVDADMPSLGGADALVKIRKTEPDMPGIIISGTPSGLRHWSDAPNTTLVTKPFQMSDLTESVTRLLAGRTPVSRDGGASRGPQ